VQEVALPIGASTPIPVPAGSPPLALGLAERGRDELVYNSAILVWEGRTLLKHRKVYLPTYGLFEEGRFFAPGRDVPRVVTLPCGWRVGLLVCEDFWHPSLPYLVAMQDADVLVVLSAAPGREEPAAPQDPAHSLFRSTETWGMIARCIALQYGIFVVLANRAGIEGGVTFAGHSLVAGPDGEILAQAPQAEAATLDVSLVRTALRRARTPFAHLRDEDPGFLRRAVETLWMEG
jgi:predicted amidohydrolase